MVSRRQVLGGVAGMAAGGNPLMRPDQALQPLSRAGTGPAPQNQFLVNPVIIVTPGRGVFIYSPTPGAGHLIASIAASSGTDKYGNAYLSGVNTYSSFGAFNAGLSSGALTFSHATSEAGPWTQVAEIDPQAFGVLQINSATSLLMGTAGAGITVLFPSGDTSGATDSANFAAALTGGATYIQLVQGTYYINAPIQPPNASAIVGTGSAINNSLRTPVGTEIIAVSGFTGTGVIEWITTAASPIGNTTLRGFHIDLSAAPNTTHGLYAFSNVYGNLIEDVSLLGPGGAGTGIGLDMVFDGTSGQPDGWFINNLLIMAMGNGIFAQAADMIWDHIHVIQSVGDGARLRTLANSIISNSRMANGGGNGWNLGDSGTGSASPDATIQMVNCNSQINALNGCLIDWPAGGGQMVTLAGYTSVNDGQGGLAAGVAITGGTAASMTVIAGLNVAANATGPAFGLDITGASNLTLSSAGLWAIGTGTAFNNTSTGVVQNRGLIGKLGAGAWAAIADNA